MRRAVPACATGRSDVPPISSARCGQARMAGGRVVRPHPPHGPERGRRPREVEHPGPAHGEQDRRDHGRGDDAADGRAGVDDAHGRRAFAHGEPLGDGLGRGRESRRPRPTPSIRRLAASIAEAGGQPVAGAGQRPPHHDDEEAQARPERVDQLPADDVHQAVGEQKGGIEVGERLVGDRNLLSDLPDGHRQRLPVEVADGDGGAQQNGDPPARAGQRGSVGLIIGYPRDCRHSASPRARSRRCVPP